MKIFNLFFSYSKSSHKQKMANLAFRSSLSSFPSLNRSHLSCFSCSSMSIFYNVDELLKKKRTEKKKKKKKLSACRSMRRRRREMRRKMVVEEEKNKIRYVGSV